MMERVLVRDGAYAAPVAEPRAPGRVEVRDGSRTVWLRPAEISVAEAAVNHVELHTEAGAMLSRTTLARLEAKLRPHGFARAHRSRLVNLARVRRTETAPSGDFTLTPPTSASISPPR